MSQDVSDAAVAPEFTTRRARRDAERRAEAAPAFVPIPRERAVPAAVVAPEQVTELTPTIVSLTEPEVADVPEPEAVSAPVHHYPIQGGHVVPVQRRARRRRSIGRALYSTGAMVFAAALAVGMTLPANLFGTLAPVVASELPANLNVPAERQQALDVAETIIAAEATGVHNDYSSESFADSERARYQASGQGFAPGFIPTAGAIRWPFAHSVPITSGFGYSVEYGGNHSGIDFIPGAGAPVSAIADGVVLWVGWDGSGYGYYVKIQSQVGEHQITAIYAHLIDNSATMYPGQLIKVGDFIGLTGDTGYSYGAHLHLGIQQDGVFVDPFVWLTEHATNTTP